MAGGSYSRMPMPKEPTQAPIPPRATRQLQVVRDDTGPDEDEKATRWLPEVHREKETRFLPEVHTGIPVYEIKEHPLRRHRSWLQLLIICMAIVVVGALVLISASIFQRPGQPQLIPFPEGQVYHIQVGGSVDNVDTWTNSNGPLPPRVPIHIGPYSVLSKPTITVAFINQVLASYHSPAAGKGQALYDDGVKYGIDPVFALAFFMHESRFGTTGVATVTRSLGNIRATPGYARYQGYRRYHRWEDGFEDWYRLIAKLYVAQWGLSTVDQIVPVYAPGSDNNDVEAYIAAVKQAVDTWRSGSLEV